MINTKIKKLILKSKISLSFLSIVATIFVTLPPVESDGVVMQKKYSDNSSIVIDNVNFYKYEQNNWLQTNQSEFQLGSFVKTDATTVENSIILDKGLLPSDWWNLNWNYRQKIRISNNSLHQFDNFQVQISINNTNTTFWSNVAVDGRDVRFVTNTGIVYWHWFQTWNYAGKNAEIWVKVDSVAASASKEFYIYYGNSSAVNIQNFDNTFTKDQDSGNPWNDSNLISEWHFDEGAGMTTADNADSNTALLINSPTWQALDGGQWGNVVGQSFSTGSHLLFNGTNNYAVVNSNNNLNISQNFSVELWANVVSTNTNAKMEVGTVTATNSWTVVNLQNRYKDPIVIVSTWELNNPNSAVSARVKNVRSSSFEIVLQGPPDNFSPCSGGICPTPIFANENVNYIVIESGSWLIGGQRIDAGKVSTNITSHGVVGSSPANWTGINVNFNPAFPVGVTPIVLHSVMTNNDSNWISSFVSRQGNASLDATRTGFQISLNGAQAYVTHETEEIGWIAISSAITGSYSGVNFETKFTGNIRGKTDGGGCFTTNFTSAYTANPIVIGSKSRMADSDGNWTNQCSVSTTQVGFYVSEDQTTDIERSSPNDRAGFIVFSQPFNTQSKDLISKKGSYVIELLNNELLGWINDENYVSTTISIGSWHHIVLTYDGVMQILYYDGVPISSSTYSATINSNMNNLFFGRLINSFIDEVKIYNKSMPENEIIAHYYRRKFISPNVSVSFVSTEQDKLSGYQSAGTFISQTFDSAESRTYFAYLEWSAFIPVGTELKFQVASNNDNLTWNFVGPDGTSGTYFSSSETKINSSLNFKRYFRIKAYFSTSNNLFSPQLNDFLLIYYKTSLTLPSSVIYVNGSVSSVKSHPLLLVETLDSQFSSSKVNVETDATTFFNAQNVVIKSNEINNQIVVLNENIIQPSGINENFNSSNSVLLTIDEKMQNPSQLTSLPILLKIYILGDSLPVIFTNFKIDVQT